MAPLVVDEVKEGETQTVDEWILRSLRRADDPSVPDAMGNLLLVVEKTCSQGPCRIGKAGTMPRKRGFGNCFGNPRNCRVKRPFAT